LDSEAPCWGHHQLVMFDLPSDKVDHDKHNTHVVKAWLGGLEVAFENSYLTLAILFTVLTIIKP
jgi:hypothetical protein